MVDGGSATSTKRRTRVRVRAYLILTTRKSQNSEGI